MISSTGGISLEVEVCSPERIKANPEEKQMLGPPLSQCWRGHVCCKNDVLSFNMSHDRVSTNVLCWKCDECLSVS